MTVHRRDWLKLAGLAGAFAAVDPAEARQAAPPATATVSAAGAGHDYRPAIEALKRYVDGHLAAYRLPGMTLSLADAEGFSAVLVAGWSDVERLQPVRPEHLFQIGSISKSFCALRLLRLVDERRLSLDADLHSLLPGAALPDHARITLRHVLTHSSGLPADAPVFPRGGGETLWQGFEPGTQFSYSNTGYELLGHLVEQLDGVPYHQALKAAVLDPLSMNETRARIRVADQSHFAASYSPAYVDRPFVRGGRLAPAAPLNFANAAGCVAANAGQMAIYLHWLIRAGRGQGEPLLSDASRRAFVTPAIKAPEFGPQAQYALGLAVVPVDGRPCLHHTGGMASFSSSIHVDADAGVGAFASVNARAEDDYRPRQVTAYALDLMRAVREGRPLPSPPPIPSATLVEKPSQYAGRFVAADGAAIELRPAGDGLVLVADGAPRNLQPTGDGVFTAVGPADETSGLIVKVDGGVARSVGWGERLYQAPGVAAPPPVDPALTRLAGVYDSGDPWTGQAEVVARPDGLWLGGTTAMTRLGDGAYRVGGDAWSPERARFDGDLAGRPQRLNLSGVDLRRI
ncbi:serine hydrolase domain-containing protein [Phenylobacterium montanum]|uniref:Beta-lactamase family protein n=1 Tax=Phenylobacterium montanum TaxID=2823693 RepID=A0A975G3U9_9CAUL|nr:serine hydrolase domain-containing protein [Caulobacter sp. S6]QUD90082.1 beta-lactamase family protein [Caulobacter sp. S6]